MGASPSLTRQPEEGRPQQTTQGGPQRTGDWRGSALHSTPLPTLEHPWDLLLHLPARMSPFKGTCRSLGKVWEVNPKELRVAIGHHQEDVQWFPLQADPPRMRLTSSAMSGYRTLASPAHCSARPGTQAPAWRPSDKSAASGTPIKAPAAGQGPCAVFRGYV